MKKRFIAAIAALPLAFSLSAAAQQAPDKPQKTQYTDCGIDPVQYCLNDPGHPGSTLSGSCSGEECFDMNYNHAGNLRLMTLHSQGAFPTTWKVWHAGTLDSSAYGNIGCGLRKSGNKDLVTVPESQYCATDLHVGNSTFYEHFLSVPAQGCLGWLECTPAAAP